MTEKILKILDNVRYWETCPDDYKDTIEQFLANNSQSIQLMQTAVVKSVCYHNFKRCTHPAVRNFDKCTKCGKIR